LWVAGKWDLSASWLNYNMVTIIPKFIK